MDVVLTLASCCGVPMIRNSVLSSFSLRKLVLIHILMSSMQCLRVLVQDFNSRCVSAESMVILGIISIPVIQYTMWYAQVSQWKRVYRIGPRTDPWGMPWIKIMGSDSRSSMTPFCDLWVRYDLIKDSAELVIPNWYFSQLRSNSCKTVSNAALKSKRTKHITLCLSIASSMSVFTLRRAVSVECPDLLADCRSFSLPVFVTCSSSWSHTALSTNLDTNDKFETGLKIFNWCWSRFNFLEVGWVKPLSCL